MPLSVGSVFGGDPFFSWGTTTVGPIQAWQKVSDNELAVCGSYSPSETNFFECPDAFIFQ
jgi:hypothetical protein